MEFLNNFYFILKKRMCVKTLQIKYIVYLINDDDYSDYNNMCTIITVRKL